MNGYEIFYGEQYVNFTEQVTVLLLSRHKILSGLVAKL
jgi:hypothetical protein